MAGMVSKASFLHGVVIAAAATTNGRAMKGQTWISGEERPFPDPSPMQQDKDITQCSAFHSLVVSSLLSSVSFILRWWTS